MPEIILMLKKLRPDAILPQYRHPGDAGFDLHAADDVLVPAGGVKILPTGLAAAVPEGFEMQIRLRSGAGLRTPLILPNAPATIDSGYRGELGIIVRNLSDTDFLVRKGERIAQGVIAPVFTARFVECGELPPSARGGDGYGSTGKE